MVCNLSRWCLLRSGPDGSKCHAAAGRLARHYMLTCNMIKCFRCFMPHNKDWTTQHRKFNLTPLLTMWTRSVARRVPVWLDSVSSQLSGGRVRHAVAWRSSAVQHRAACQRFASSSSDTEVTGRSLLNCWPGHSRLKPHAKWILVNCVAIFAGIHQGIDDCKAMRTMGL